MQNLLIRFKTELLVNFYESVNIIPHIIHNNKLIQQQIKKRMIANLGHIYYPLKLNAKVELVIFCMVIYTWTLL